MRDAQHAANSAQIRRAATVAAKAIGTKHYRLITQYFAAGYFSTRQALQLDALRYAIDLADLSEADRDWALAAWLGHSRHASQRTWPYGSVPETKQ